jgi:small ubiquitin-related modifier
MNPDRKPSYDAKGVFLYLEENRVPGLSDRKTYLQPQATTYAAEYDCKIVYSPQPLKIEAPHATVKPFDDRQVTPPTVRRDPSLQTTVGPVFAPNIQAQAPPRFPGGNVLQDNDTWAPQYREASKPVNYYGPQRSISGASNQPYYANTKVARPYAMSESANTPKAMGEDPVPSLPDHLNIKVTDNYNEVFFKIKRNTHMSKLMNAFCDKQGKSVNSCRFLFDGQRVHPDDTPEKVCSLFSRCPALS